MLAQLNSKQKSIFLNIKPTVIDKLISKNKSSIQHNLLYDNDDSDESLSEDSENSSSTSQENSLVSVLKFPAIMPQLRKSAKAGVLGSKISGSQFPTKRGCGRPPNAQRQSNKNIKVVAAKTVLGNSRRASPRKIGKDVRSPVKLKRRTTDKLEPLSVNNKHPRSSVRKENCPSTLSSSISKSREPIIIEKSPKALKEMKNVSSDVDENSSGSKVQTRQNDAQTASSTSFDVNSSPRKFPSNVMDCWKSTGMVIRGRGRPRGSTSRGPLRGKSLRTSIRSERYNTRDSQTGLMRSGKRRKCQDPNLVEGLEGLRKRRRVFDRIKKEKNECFSDEHSSYVTTSELSFGDIDNSLKQSDDETVNPNLMIIKKEIGETEFENTQNKGSISKVIKINEKEKRGYKSSSECNSSISKIDQVSVHTTRISIDSNSKVSTKRKLVLKTETYDRDSSCSLGSNVTDESIHSGLKHYKKKSIDAAWVRRSTRSIGKQDDRDPEAVASLKENHSNVDSGNKSKSPAVVSTLTNSVSLVTMDSSAVPGEISNQNNIDVIEIPLKNQEKDINNFADRVCINNSIINIKEEFKPNEKSFLIDDESIASESDQIDDFTLSIEETPVKKPDALILENNIETVRKLNIDDSSNVHRPKVNENLSNPNHENDPKVCINVEKIDVTITNDLLNSNTQHSNKTQSSISKIISEENTASMELEISDNSVVNVTNGTSIKDNKLYINEFNNSEFNSENINISLCEKNISETDKDVIEENIILESLKEMTNQVEKTLMLEQSHNEQESDFITHASFQNPDRIHFDCDSNLIENSIDINSYTIQSDETENSCVRANLHTADSPLIEDNDKINDIYENHLNPDTSKGVNKGSESSEESSSDSNSNMSEPITSQFENNSTDMTIINSADNDSISRISIDNMKEQIKSEIEVCSENKQKEAEVCHSQSQSSYYSSLESSESNSMDPNKETICGQNNSVQSISGDISKDERPSKELLSALGLQSLQSISEDKPKRPLDSYTGTLKAVIKLNRSSDKKSGGGKMIFKQCDMFSEDPGGSGDRLEYRIRNTQDLSTEGVPLTHLADIPANRKGTIKVKSQFDLSNSPNIVGAGGSHEITDSNKETGSKQNLIIPEKSSSFSIHPERLCTDVCSYCFGKFGSLDTPCHLAQLKNSERQSKILAIEVHLSADSCLCDGCFRYVDRKANCPASQRSRKPAAKRGPLAGTLCAVQECTQPARHSVRRKWLIKLKKSIGKKLVIDMEKNPHLPFPLCSQHYYWVDYFTVCGICKKRLTRNHMYALGPEADELNKALSHDGIPVRLSDKLFLCKLCRYYSSLRLKYKEPSSISSTHQLFLNSYRKKILHYHDIPISESEEEGKSLEEESNIDMAKPKKKKSKSKSFDSHESKKKSQDKGEKSDPGKDNESNNSQMIDYSYLDSLNVHREENPTPTVNYSNLDDFESEVGFSNIASFLNPLEGSQGAGSGSRADKPTRIQVKFGNLNIGKLSNLNIGQDSRQPSSSSNTVERPPFLPGERELKLTSEFEFHGSLSPSSSWERCTSTIQFDRDTKKLWHELQRPYGNQSSFLRHLVMLEKHWRSGSLVLSENPNPRALKYINSVRNRVQAYDGANTEGPIEQQKQPESNLLTPPPRPMSTPVKNISVPPPLMKITPGTAPWLQDQLKRPPPYSLPSSSQIKSTKSRIVPITAPPPYRLSVAKPYQVGPRTMRLPVQSPYTQVNRSPHNSKPLSISYQQFKKIRLEQVPASTSQVTVIPKHENVRTRPSSTSSVPSTDFVPLISDVRSLASSESDWNESFRKQQQKMLKQNVAKYYTPILPKVPNSLTVTTYPQSSSAVIMKTSSLTIEKAPNKSTKPNISLPEKPSISVFRETSLTEND